MGYLPEKKFSRAFPKLPFPPPIPRFNLYNFCEEIRQKYIYCQTIWAPAFFGQWPKENTFFPGEVIPKFSPNTGLNAWNTRSNKSTLNPPCCPNADLKVVHSKAVYNQYVLQGFQSHSQWSYILAFCCMQPQVCLGSVSLMFSRSILRECYFPDEIESTLLAWRACY